MLTSLFLFAMAGLACAAAWASWPIAQPASLFLGILGGIAAVSAVLVLTWTA